MPADGAEPSVPCCEACASATASDVSLTPEAPVPVPILVAGPVPILVAGPVTVHIARPRRPLAMVEPPQAKGIGISRIVDRRIAFGGMAVSAVYLALALASLLLPAATRLGSWVPLHLALAGAATTAIAALLPFFAAAMVVAPPARPAIRIGGITLVAIGAGAVIAAHGYAPGQSLQAALAGGTFLSGLGLVGLAALTSVRRANGPRRMLVERAYGLALANVAVGATIATLLIGGNQAVGGAWGMLKPAHAWLNLVGFASLVVQATLLHLAPTIAGARIRTRASARIAVIGIAAGAPTIAFGFITGIDLAARAGALAMLAGGLAAGTHGLVIHRDPSRGTWTTDAGWHRFTSGSVLLGQIWFGLGLALAATRVLILGTTPASWAMTLIVGPLVIGGALQILIGAMAHLAPTIGPGDPIQHALQRRLVGRWSNTRIVLLNVGAAGVAVGFGLGSVPDDLALGRMLVGLGLGSAAIALGGTLVLLALAAQPGRGALICQQRLRSPHLRRGFGSARLTQPDDEGNHESQDQAEPVAGAPHAHGADDGDLDVQEVDLEDDAAQRQAVVDEQQPAEVRAPPRQGEREERQ